MTVRIPRATHSGRRIAVSIPLLILFLAAPFERTDPYGGEAPRWLSALALTLELSACGWRWERGFNSGFFQGEA